MDYVFRILPTQDGLAPLLFAKRREIGDGWYTAPASSDDPLKAPAHKGLNGTVASDDPK